MRANNRHRDRQNRRFFTALTEILRAIFPHPPLPPGAPAPENSPEQDNSETSPSQMDTPDAGNADAPTPVATGPPPTDHANTDDPKSGTNDAEDLGTPPAKKPCRRRVAPKDSSVHRDEDKQ